MLPVPRPNHLSAAVMHTLKMKCWHALKTDNAEELCRALITAAGSKAMVPSVMARLEIELWAPAKQKQMRAQERTPRGLVCVASINRAGVPPEGAVRCLEMLLRVFDLFIAPEPEASQGAGMVRQGCR